MLSPKGKLKVVKQAMARVNTDIEESVNYNGPEWANLIQMTIISTTVGKNMGKKWNSFHSQQKSLKCSTWMQSEKQQKNFCSFPRQTIQYHSNPSLCPNQ